MFLLPNTHLRKFTEILINNQTIFHALIYLHRYIYSHMWTYGETCSCVYSPIYMQSNIVIHVFISVCTRMRLLTCTHTQPITKTVNMRSLADALEHTVTSNCSHICTYTMINKPSDKLSVASMLTVIAIKVFILLLNILEVAMVKNSHTILTYFFCTQQSIISDHHNGGRSYM